jgi:hypothetical protein
LSRYSIDPAACDGTGRLLPNLGIAGNVFAAWLRQLLCDGVFERVHYRTDPDRDEGEHRHECEA